MKFLTTLLSVFVCPAYAAAAAAGAVEIKLATILPKDTSGYQRLMEVRDAWRKTSGETVKITVYPGWSDGETQLVKKMRAGQLQGALVSSVGLAQIDRSVTCLQLMPLQFRTWSEVDYVREKIRGDLEARLRKAGFEVLFWADAGWVRFFSKDPAVRPDDLKPMKLFVWTGDPQQLSILRGLGYHPVGLETEQIVPSLTTGMINAVPAPPFLANALQYNKFTGHMIDLEWVPIVGAAVVRSDTWEKIAPDTRETLLKIAAPIAEQLRRSARAEDLSAIAAMKKRGLVVHSPTPEVVAEWRSLAQHVLPQIRGTMVPAELFDRVQAHVADYRAANATAETP